MAAKLVLTFDNNVVSEHPLVNDETTIGRRFSNDVHIDNLGISGTHAKVLMMGGSAFIEDLQSTNGTYVNGTRIDKKPLSNGDIITVGKYQLRYEQEATAEADDFEKTVILSANAVSMEPPKAAAPKPAPSTGKAALVVAAGSNKGKTMPISKSVTRLGKPGNQAAAIAKRPQGYFFVNVGGEGTTPLLNGKKVAVGALRLNSGDQITIGKIDLLFKLS